MIKRYVFFGIMCIFLSLQAFVEHEIVVVTPSYNNKQWYLNNLNSIFSQNYSNYRVIYIDDCSTDGMGQLVDQYVAQHGVQDRIQVIHNKERKGALYNFYHAIHSCSDQTIIVILDGDDWFAHKDVLAYLNKVYQDPHVWITYGQFQEYPSGTRGFCCPIPKQIIQNNAYRSFHLTPSHLRTFYAGLFKRIKREDLLYHDEFFQMTCDQAMMFPMMEMAAGRFKFIPQILCIYNDANPLNDHKVSKKQQLAMHYEIRSRTPYKKIDSLW